MEAGAALLRGSSIRDWRGLTVRAVAERAEVSERTVYRQFGDQRGLRDAVMQRLEREAGVDLDGLRLEDLGGHARRILEHVAAYPLPPRQPLDPTLGAAGQRQRQALLTAIADRTPDWSEDERTAAAALVDVLWSVGTYERLVADWHLDSEQAIGVVGWAIDLVGRAVEAGRVRP